MTSTTVDVDAWPVRDRWLALVAVAVIGGLVAGLLIGAFWVVVEATVPA